MAKKAKPFCYAVKRGRKTGLFYDWNECSAQVTGFSGAQFKSFPDVRSANIYLRTGGNPINSRKPTKWYGVARGLTPGVYNQWSEVQDQILGFHGARQKSFATRAEAEEFVRRESGIRPNEEVKAFHTFWDEYDDFAPNPTAPFGDEFSRLASSQGWRGEEFKRQKVIALRKEIDQHYFSQQEAVSKKEEEDDDDDASNHPCEHCGERSIGTCVTCKQVYYCSMDCVDDHYFKHVPTCKELVELRGYQNLCYQIRKPPGDTIPECIAVLKGKPYVNLVDFVDVRRTGEPIQLWTGWDAFMEYTLNTDGKTINLQFAKQDKLLATLLQDFSSGPHRNAIDCEVPNDKEKLTVRPGKVNSRVLKRGVTNSGVISGRVEKPRRADSAVHVKREERSETPESDRVTTYSDDDGSELSDPYLSDPDEIHSDDDLQIRREKTTNKRHKAMIWRQHAEDHGGYTQACKEQFKIMMWEIESDEERYGL